MSRSPRPRLAALVALGLVATIPATAGAEDGFLTDEPAMLTLDASAPAGSQLVPIINSGEEIGGFMFEGIPDGIGGKGGGGDTVDVFVNHEQSRVPFAGLADLVDSSVSRLTLDAATGAVLDTAVPIPSSAGFLRFCSATMAGPREGLDRRLFFTGEESPDIVDVPAGAPYGPDPQLGSQRQGGYAVVLNPRNGEYTQVPGMGRHNHENSMVVPGGWDQVAVLSGDDTFFNQPFPDWSQLYLYLADDSNAIVDDEGRLFAFQVTRTEDGPVDPGDPFNEANDYGDITTGDHWRGRFIPVPEDVAKGLTAETPQDGLENWSNAHNVFQFIRVEDTAYDPNNRRVVYVADTGDRRMVADPATGRLTRNSSAGPFGPYPNGRVFKMRFDRENPRRVIDFSILLNADTGGENNPAVLHQPDNMGTSPRSLMVQEDTTQLPGSRVWNYDFSSKEWSVVAQVNDIAWESSGIVSAAPWFGRGWWLLDVQAHNVFIDQEVVGAVTYKREAGQLLLMKIPGS